MMTPIEIGSYTITRELGRGGMGVVLLARDGKLDRDVAIRVFRRSWRSMRSVWRVSSARPRC